MGRASRERLACLLLMPAFKPGDPPPTGYLEWHEWAEVQRKAGIKQSMCTRCGLWRTPQEKCCDGARRMTVREWNAENKRIERQVKRDYPSQEVRYQREVRAARRRGDLPR